MTAGPYENCPLLFHTNLLFGKRGKVMSIYRSIRVDTLTGMNNQLALTESDLGDAFGSEGMMLYFNLMNLNTINQSFGINTGNSYLKECSDIINNELIMQKLLVTGILAYRSLCNDFIIRFPSGFGELIESFVANIQQKIKTKMNSRGIIDAGIHFVVWPYFNSINSVTDLLKQCYLNLYPEYGNHQTSFGVPLWADMMINSLLSCVNETLSLLQKSNSMALLDDISQLPNHRAATLYLDDAIKEYRASRKTFTILFIDGDELKKFNERGYQYGNEMIRNIGALINGSIRHQDKVFRWLSGDEFLVLLHETNKETGYILAERIREHIEVISRGWENNVSVSIGVASCPVDGFDVDTLLLMAENANTKAKKAGKNCVM